MEHTIKNGQKPKEGHISSISIEYENTTIYISIYKWEMIDGFMNEIGENIMTLTTNQLKELNIITEAIIKLLGD